MTIRKRNRRFAPCPILIFKSEASHTMTYLPTASATQATCPSNVLRCSRQHNPYNFHCCYFITPKGECRDSALGAIYGKDVLRLPSSHCHGL